MRQFHPAIFCLIIAIVLVLSGCSVKNTRSFVKPETIVGKTMEEVLEMDGKPWRRTSDQLTYLLYTSTKVDPYWAYILVLGVAGGFPSWDMEMSGYNAYCLTLEFENNILVSHTTIEREKGEIC